MHCEPVIREMSVPSGEVSSADLAAHLAACPACALRAEREARFDRVWEMTRPAEPSDAVWEGLWANVTESFERSATPARALEHPVRLAARPWRRVAFAAFALAQAAAILIAVFALSRPHERPALHVARVTPTPPPPSAEVVIDEGQFVIIRADRQGLRTVDLAQQEASSSNTVDANFVMFNALEAMAE
jgi:hypothetical protein